MTRKPQITPDMTVQDLFNASYWGVVEQGKGCTTATGDCIYERRSDDGTVTQCGIGHCLTQDQTDIFMRMKFDGIDCISSRAPDYLPTQIAAHLQFAIELQHMHDRSTREATITNGGSFISTFKMNMGCLADKHGLTVPTL